MQKRKFSRKRKKQNNKREKEVFRPKQRLFVKYNRQIHLTILLLLLLGPIVVLCVEAMIDYFFMSPIIMAFSILFGMCGMMSFVEAWIKGYYYAGIKRVLLFIKNLFVNPFLKKEKIKKNDLKRLEKFKEEKCAGAKWWLVVGAILLIWIALEAVTGREKMVLFIIIISVSLLVTIINMLAYKKGKHYSLQYGTIVAKTRWFVFRGKFGIEYFWYTAEVKLDNGGIYEGIIYDDSDYRAFKSGSSRCIVYGISPTRVVILATGETIKN